MEDSFYKIDFKNNDVIIEMQLRLHPLNGFYFLHMDRSRVRSLNGPAISPS